MTQRSRLPLLSFTEESLHGKTIDMFRLKESRCQIRAVACALSFPTNFLPRSSTTMALFGKKVMLGKKTCSEMSDFWAHAKTHACIQDCSAGSPDRVVPLAVHGDEVPVVGRGKVWCANRPWSCLGTACGRPTSTRRSLFRRSAQPLKPKLRPCTGRFQVLQIKMGTKYTDPGPCTHVELQWNLCAQIEMDRTWKVLHGPGIEGPGHVEAQGCDDSLTPRPPNCHR